MVTLYDMLALTDYFQPVWIYSCNSFDQNMLILKGDISEARSDDDVWQYLMRPLDGYDCSTGILILYVQDENYNEPFERQCPNLKRSVWKTRIEIESDAEECANK